MLKGRVSSAAHQVISDALTLRVQKGPELKAWAAP